MGRAMSLTIPSPLRPAAPSPLASRLDSLLPSLADARLLLVDDDPGMIQMLGRLLSGYSQLRFATDGEQALALAQAWQPELVLLDAEMPGIDGFEVCRRLKADPLLAEVPVIFVTQHTDARVESAVFELGAADFVAKPVAGPALRAPARPSAASPVARAPGPRRLPAARPSARASPSRR